MDKRNVCIIFNPAARGGKALSLYAELKALAGDVPIFTSEEADAITELAASVVKQGYDHLIAAGGGGPANGIINGTRTADVLFSVFPSGTSNVFPYEPGTRSHRLKKYSLRVTPRHPKPLTPILPNH